MNNIYVDELPKSCDECPMTYREHSFGRLRCQFNGECIEYEQKHPNCPLKPLSDRLEEERKKIVQEIRNKVKQAKLVYEWKGDEVHIEDILDQIERGK